MDIVTLRVFNETHKLGIAEQEFSEIEEERKYRERTGLAVMLKKQGHHICVSHDDKHKIIIQDLTLSPLTDLPVRILFKTLIIGFDVPEEIYTLHQIAHYRASDTEVKYVAQNLSELKAVICDRFADEYPKELGEMYEEVYADSKGRKKNEARRPVLVEKQLKAIYWLFGEEYKSEDIPSRVNVCRIVKVFTQIKNRRVAIIQEKQDFTLTYGGMFRRYQEVGRVIYYIKSYKPSNQEYNYVCPNREIVKSTATHYGENPNEIWVSDELFEKVTPNELEAISRHAKEWTLLTQEKYKELSKDIGADYLREKREKESEEAERILTRNIRRQFGRGKLTRAGITFTKKKVSHETLSFQSDKISSFLVSTNILLDVRPDIIAIYGQFIDYIDRNSENPKESIKVNGMTIKIEKRKHDVLVNGIRIWKKDMLGVLKKAITYSDQKQYEEWLRYTSKVCLEFQEILQSGNLETTMCIRPNREENCLELPENEVKIAIPVKRHDNRNWVMINKKEFVVKNLKSFLNLQTLMNYDYYPYGDNLDKAVKTLYKALSKVSSYDIAQLISDGIKQYKKAQRLHRKKLKEMEVKSKEFLAHAVKLTKAIKVRGGYFVKGTSQATYFVNEVDCTVWTIRNGKQDQYLCIADIGEIAEGRAGINDRIAQRLLCLSEDKKVANEIFSRGDKMDKHWLSLEAEA